MLFCVQLLKEQLGFRSPGSTGTVGAARGSADWRPGPASPLPRPPQGRSRLGPARGGGEGVTVAESLRSAGSGLRGCARTGAVAAEPAGVRGHAGRGLGAEIRQLSCSHPSSPLPRTAAAQLRLAFPFPRIPHPQLLPLPPLHPSRDFSSPKASAPLLDPLLPVPIP